MPRLGFLVLVLALGAQQAARQQEEPAVVLPGGKPQKMEILKADYEKNKSEAAELVELAQQLKEAIDKNEQHVLDLRAVKKAEEIEKLARRIKERMRRFY
ncbi:MAG: hypothetical protein HY236_00770 [Acidobacteria bacterium]|nr:hypothetical protein [Acidobacteriota bacterium]